MPQTTDRPVLALLIDADNLSPDYAEAIMRETCRLGRPAVRRIYGDWHNPNLQGWRDKLHATALVAVQSTANTDHKNASDFTLVIDAMDLLYTDRFDGFIIASSDSDFTSLVNRLRENDKMVVVLGEEKAPNSLKRMANRFTLLSSLSGQKVIDPPVVPAISDVPKATKQPKACDIITKALERTPRPDGWVGLSQLGKEIRQSHPDFKPSAYNHSTLKKLVKSISKFECLDRNGGQVRVKL